MNSLFLRALSWGVPAALGLFAATWITSDPFEWLSAASGMAVASAAVALVTFAAPGAQRARFVSTSIVVGTLALWAPGVLDSSPLAQGVCFAAATAAALYAARQFWRSTISPQAALSATPGAWGFSLGAALAIGLWGAPTSGLFHLAVPAALAALARSGAPRDAPAQLSLLATLAVCAAMALSLSPNSARRDVRAALDAGSPGPSVIVIVLDTLRRDHMSLYGYARNTTPEIDAWARGGTVFERAVSTAPWTLPSHASLFTGLFPRAHGAHGYRGDLGFGNAYPLAGEHVTLAELARDAGVVTGAIVANHFYLSPHFGLDQGFSTYWSERPRGGLRFAPAEWLANQLERLGVWRERRAYYQANRITDLAIDWIDSTDERGFFLFLNYLDVHLPNERPATSEIPREAGESDLDEEEQLEALKGRPLTEGQRLGLRNSYDRELQELDRQVGRLLRHLEETGIADRTTVFLTSDHGEYLGEHDMIEHCGHLHREVLDIPLIVRGPGIDAGRTDRSVQLVDVFPAVLERLAIAQPEASGPDRGSSIFGTARSEIVSEWYPAASPVQRAPELGGRFDREIRAIQFGPHKLFADDRGGRELFDLDADAHEQHNIADEAPDVRASLETRLRAWLDRNPTPERREADLPEVDAETLEQIRALGYAQ